MTGRNDVPEVRLGFVGCGGNAQGHLRRLGQLAGVRIVGVCDVVAQLADSTASATGAVAYTDSRALLERTDLDAIYLSLPVFAHGAPEMAVIERGLPFFVEKPIARELSVAREIEAAALCAGILTCVGYQLRYCGSADLARELLAAPSAGPIGIAAGTYWCGSGRTTGRWYTQQALSGGQLVEQATHTLDMLRFLVGEVAEVFCYQARRIVPAETGDCPDVYAAALRFADGAIGTLNTTWASHPDDWSRANLIDIGFGECRLHWTTRGITVAHGREVQEHARADASIDAIFVDAVRRGDPSAIRSPYADAVRSLAVSLAANESSARGGPIMVQL